MKIFVISFYALLLAICISYLAVPFSEQSDFLRMAVSLPIGGMIYHSIDEIAARWKF